MDCLKDVWYTGLLEIWAVVCLDVVWLPFPLSYIILYHVMNYEKPCQRNKYWQKQSKINISHRKWEFSTTCNLENYNWKYFWRIHCHLNRSYWLGVEIIGRRSSLLSCTDFLCDSKILRIIFLRLKGKASSPQYETKEGENFRPRRMFLRLKQAYLDKLFCSFTDGICA